jgi:pathogen-inducible salicylic acid glucosyltransferase
VGGALLASDYITKKMEAQKTHCLVFPFPATGHMNPILQFSKKLQQKGLKVTLATPRFMLKTAHKISDSINIEPVSDGYDEAGYAEAESFEEYGKKFKEIGSKTLAQVIEKLRFSECPVNCVIYDPSLTWILDVTKSFGIIGVAFFTQPCAVSNVYYHVHSGLLKLPILGSSILVEGLVTLDRIDIPSFISDPDSYPTFFGTVVNQFSNIDKADWILCNTFYELEKEVVDEMRKRWQLGTIGPTIPSYYLDGKNEDDKGYGINVFKPNTSSCIKWLDERQKGSVVYVAFGSLAELGTEQMEELAEGLKLADKYFLWIVRSTEETKLPKHFLEETQAKGLIVSWCPQLEVLAHEAIGCFITHCGWNSTLEALSLGVPIVGMPQWTDQPTNCKYVTDVWKTGVRARPDEKGMVNRETVEFSIREVMEGEKAKEISANARKWKQLARAAAREGGCSDKNIDEFVGYLQEQTKQ